MMENIVVTSIFSKKKSLFVSYIYDFNLDQSKILLFGTGLSSSEFQP